MIPDTVRTMRMQLFPGCAAIGGATAIKARFGGRVLRVLLSMGNAKPQAIGSSWPMYAGRCIMTISPIEENKAWPFIQSLPVGLAITDTRSNLDSLRQGNF